MRVKDNPMKKILLILLVAALSATAQETTPAGPNLSFDQANAVVKYDCTSVVVNADGSGETLRRYRVALLSDRAVRQYSQDETVYNLGYDTVQVVAARVYLPDGKIIDVDSSSIKDVPLPAFGKFYLQNVREKIITFPALQKGAEIEVIYKELTREPPMDGQFNMSEYFEHSDPVQTKVVDVSLPNTMPLHWKTRGQGIGHVSYTSGDREVHTWQISDVPQIVPEPGMPPFPEVSRQLLVTTIPDWETWSKWYYDLAEPEMVADSSIKAEVVALTKGKGRDEAIRSIFQFVSNKIRYVDTALTGRKAGYKPESASTTYRNKYGVCRDKAALMVTMLREAGIESNIVLMNPSWKIDQEIATDQFNHAIVSVKDGDSQIFIDPTVEKTTEFLAANEQDRGVLTCTEQGNDLAWTPVEDAEKNLYRVSAKSKVDEQGALTSTINIDSRGFPDLALRSYMQSISPEERDILFQSFVQSLAPTARLDELTMTDLTDLDTPLAIILKVSAQDYAIQAGQYWLLNSIAQGRKLDFLSSWLLSGSELTNRRYPLRLSSTFAVQMSETVEYPKGFKVRSLPDDLSLSNGDFNLSRKCTTKGQSITVKQSLRLDVLDIPLSRYSNLLEMVNRFDALDRGKLVLTIES
jgi:transglutaminase-like putative cysteine protease